MPDLPRRSLRYRQAWLAIGLLIALAITVTCLVPARELPQLGVAIWDKLEHAFAFFVLCFWFAGVVSRRDYLYLVLAMLAFGGAIEIAQGLMGLGREADLHDLMADGLGVFVALLLALTPLGRWAVFVESLFHEKST
ncbi:MAG: hypothetical protein RLZZ200_311 [Pseudomonadota bacterium]|jgi:VanZ family protein